MGGDVNNSGGVVAPGNSPGVLTIEGDYTQGSEGILSIEIGDGHDQLVVNGTATLGGSLEVTLIDNYSVNPGDSFDILDFASIVGDFATINLPDGLLWDVDSGTLITEVVPEPSGVFLCVVCFWSYCGFTHRRLRSK